MTRKTTIALFYSGVAAVCVGIIALSMWLRQGLTAPYQTSVAINTGKDTAPNWFPIAKDLAGINQDSKPVKLSDLRGKVWLVAEFFAVCPKCAARNGTELRMIYDEFKGNPDFHITCVSIDPGNDNVEKLGDYGKALGADSKNWWFFNAGDEKATHDYMERTLKFMGIRNRVDALDIEANGKFLHDMAFTLVDRDFNVIGKWNLVGSKSEEGQTNIPGLYEKDKEALLSRIRLELAKTNSSNNL